MIGAEGIGIYQNGLPHLYHHTGSGRRVSVAISVLISRKETQGYTGTRKIFKVSTGHSICIWNYPYADSNAIGSFIANVILVIRELTTLSAVAPAIFFAGMMSVFRGFFRDTNPWFLLPYRVIEQLFRVTAVLILAVILLPRGIEFAAAGATFGAVVGGLFGLMVLGVYYWQFRKNERELLQPLKYSGTTSKELGIEMVRLAIPVSFGAVVLPLVQMLDAIIVPGRLIALNYTTSQATAMFGHLSGMAAVLISLPTIFTISIATSLVPAISEALAQKDHPLLRSRINYAFRAGMIISFPCAAGLYILAFQICDLLYGMPEAGIPLEPMAFSCIALAAFQLSSAGLQGIGRPEIAMRHLIITGILKVIFNYTLTSVPMLNIKGAAIGTVIAFTIGSLLNIIYLQRLTGVKYETGRALKIAIVTVLMAIAVKISYGAIVGMDISSHIATAGAILIGISIYGILLFITKELDLNMLKMIRS